MKQRHEFRKLNIREPEHDWIAVVVLMCVFLCGLGFYLAVKQ